MGTVRKPRKKYEGPSHPWERERIDEEKILSKEYGLKNKKEIWKIASKLRRLKQQAKKLIASDSEQAKIEEKLLLERLARLGLVGDGAVLDDILEINIRKLLDRRLQSVMVTRGLARTSRQARQMISHGHVMIKGRKTDIPSCLMLVSEESDITYAPSSAFTDKEHPELTITKKELRKKVDVVESLPEEKPVAKEDAKVVESKEAGKEEVKEAGKEEAIKEETKEVAKEQPKEESK